MAKTQNIVEWIPATIGFMLGIIFLLILDSIIPHLHLHTDKPEGLKEKNRKNNNDGTCCYTSQYSRRLRVN